MLHVAINEDPCALLTLARGFAEIADIADVRSALSSSSMAKKVRERNAVTPVRRAFLRAPIALYHMGLGRLLGSRFLLLHHTGRKSGKLRETVLEVVDTDEASDTYYVAVGFGTSSDWFRNLQHTPRARIEIGSRTLDVIAHPLTVPEAAERMRSYARRHPKTARMLAKVMGFEVDGSEDDFAALPALGLQLVAFRPHQAAVA